uniref:C-C motif chemokine 19-like n=1 Tax=Semicossyphus pulcher TaxID=241346 RepID=UPI0037E92432
MAPMTDAKLIFCFLFITCTVTLAEIPMDCCLSVHRGEPLEKTAIVHVHKQISGQGCSIDATILVTRRGKNLCMPSDEPWVADVEKHVVFLKKLCKKNKYKGKRCFGVKPEYN